MNKLIFFFIFFEICCCTRNSYNYNQQQDEENFNKKTTQNLNRSHINKKLYPMLKTLQEPCFDGINGSMLYFPLRPSLSASQWNISQNDTYVSNKISYVMRRDFGVYEIEKKECRQYNLFHFWFTDTDYYLYNLSFDSSLFFNIKMGIDKLPSPK